MSTAELKRLIEARTLDERKWMTAYLLDEMFAVLVGWTVLRREAWRLRFACLPS